MKKSELRRIIREEVQRCIISEGAKDDLKALAKLGLKGKVGRAIGPGEWLMMSKGPLTVQVKRFDEPSEDWGLNGGRISKLYIKDEQRKHDTGTGVVVAHYDRGWDVKPVDSAAKKLVDQIVKALA